MPFLTFAPVIDPDGQVSPEFHATSMVVLGQLFSRVVPEARAAITSTIWRVKHHATSHDASQVVNRPKAGEMLLGMFTHSPETITLFEQEVRRFSRSQGRALEDVINEIMVHELQHRFGVNHILSPVEVAVPSPPALAEACGC